MIVWIVTTGLFRWWTQQDRAISSPNLRAALYTFDSRWGGHCCYCGNFDDDHGSDCGDGGDGGDSGDGVDGGDGGDDGEESCEYYLSAGQL